MAVAMPSPPPSPTGGASALPNGGMDTQLAQSLNAPGLALGDYMPQPKSVYGLSPQQQVQLMGVGQNEAMAMDPIGPDTGHFGGTGGPNTGVQTQAGLAQALYNAAMNTQHITNPTAGQTPAPASAPLGSSGPSGPPPPGYSVPQYSFTNGKFVPNGGTATLTGPGFGGAPNSPSALTLNGGTPSMSGSGSGSAPASPSQQNNNYPAYNQPASSNNPPNGAYGTGSGPIFGANTLALLENNPAFLPGGQVQQAAQNQGLFGLGGATGLPLNSPPA